MIDRIFRYLNVVAVIFFVALVILAAPTFFDPEIEVINNSSEAVSVVVEWRNHSRDIGFIQPKSSYAFSVDDEAAVTFKVSYVSGKKYESEPLYFTSGIKVIAQITNDGVEVGYDHDT